MKPEKVLILGASGAMGQYLVPYLAKKGCKVDAVALNDMTSDDPDITWYKGNAKDWAFRNELFANRYDAILDFLTYNTKEVPFYLPHALDNTDHYFYVSSARIYDDLECPVKETSPRLIDSSKDEYLLNSDDYCIYKARGENILRAGGRKNWTIIRPTTIFSYMRYQLVTLEAPDTVGRAFAGKKVVLPIQAKNKPATFSWGGDAARMIGELVFCEAALGEAFNICSAESHTWGEIADYYKDICGLESVWVDKEDYIRIIHPNLYILAYRWQLEYARLFHRVLDNSKVLGVTGLKQEDMTSLYDGLKREIDRTPRDTVFPVNQRMDDYLAAMKL